MRSRELQPVYLTLTTSEVPSPIPARAGSNVDLLSRASLLGVGNKAIVIGEEQPVAQNAVESLLARIEALKPPLLDQSGSDLAATLLSERIREPLTAMPREHPLVLIHDRESSRFPWELLRIDGRFPAVDRGLHRRYIANDLSVVKWLEERRLDCTLSILPVLNPTEGLDGADAEGARIRRLFGTSAGVRIDGRVHGEATRKRLVADFSSGAYDVIH